MKFHFWKKQSITVGNGQQIVAHKMISLPLQIQNNYFEFLALVVDMLDEYDFINRIGSSNSVGSNVSYDISHFQCST